MSDSAYFVAPPGRAGRGLLLLHSWWGLTPFCRGLADRLSDEGFTVLAPDLNIGEVFDREEEARRHLEAADPNHLARLVLSSAHLLAERAQGDRLTVVGMSMGASLGLWASVRLPDVVEAVVSLYGTQAVDFEGSRARYQLHFADSDHLVSDDDAVFMESTMSLCGLAVESHRYAGTSHWFFEEGRPEYDAKAAAEVWERMIGFLKPVEGSETDTR